MPHELLPPSQQVEGDLLNVLASVGCTLGGPLPPGAKATLETAVRSLQVWWRWGCGWVGVSLCSEGAHGSLLEGSQ